MTCHVSCLPFFFQTVIIESQYFVEPVFHVSLWISSSGKIFFDLSPLFFSNSYCEKPMKAQIDFCPKK